jgi:hypothetical protein
MVTLSPRVTQQPTYAITTAYLLMNARFQLHQRFNALIHDVERAVKREDNQQSVK